MHSSVYKRTFINFKLNCFCISKCFGEKRNLFNFSWIFAFSIFLHSFPFRIQSQTASPHSNSNYMLAKQLLSHFFAHIFRDYTSSFHHLQICTSLIYNHVLNLPLTLRRWTKREWQFTNWMMGFQCKFSEDALLS